MHGDPVSRSLRNRKAAAEIQVPGGQLLPLRASSPPPPKTGSQLLGREQELRALARPWLEAQGQGCMLDEVGLEHGQVRTDMLLLSPSTLHGLEAKSETPSRGYQPMCVPTPRPWTCARWRWLSGTWPRLRHCCRHSGACS